MLLWRPPSALSHQQRQVLHTASDYVSCRRMATLLEWWGEDRPQPGIRKAEDSVPEGEDLVREFYATTRGFTRYV